MRGGIPYTYRQTTLSKYYLGKSHIHLVLWKCCHTHSQSNHRGYKVTEIVLGTPTWILAKCASWCYKWHFAESGWPGSIVESCIVMGKKRILWKFHRDGSRIPCAYGNNSHRTPCWSKKIMCEYDENVALWPVW